MRRAAIALVLLATVSCKKAEMSEDMESPAMKDTAAMGETGGIPKITDTARIPSEADTVRDSLKKL